MEILSKVFGVVVMFGGLATLLGYAWLVLGFFTNKDNEADFFSLLSLVTICCPIMPFFVFRLKRPQKEPVILLAVGIAVSAIGIGGIDWIDDKAKQAEAAAFANNAGADASAAPAVTIRKAPPGAPPAAPPPAPVKVPEVDGRPVDLSSIMGRARALAEKWQREATLTGLDATQMNATAVQTDAGGKVTVSFGPPPFEAPTSGSPTFLVTYDKSGLKGAPSTARPGKALPEPMCAPERLAPLAGQVSLSVRYALAPDGRPAWLVSDPATPRAKPRSFDPNTCQERLSR